MSGLLLAVLAAAATVALFVIWSRAMERVAVGQRLWIMNSLLAAAIVLGVAAFIQGPGIVGGILAGVSIVFGVLFGGLGVLAPQSKQGPALEVGGPLPSFTALDDSGKPFDLASLKGRPILLKFFRGHW